LFNYFPRKTRFFPTIFREKRGFFSESLFFAAFFAVFTAGFANLRIFRGKYNENEIFPRKSIFLNEKQGLSLPLEI
jgi:hypothetical protein